MSNELQAFRLRRVIGELQDLDRMLDGWQRHVGMLRSGAKNLAPRDLLNLGNELQRETLSLDPYLSGLVGQGQGYATRIGNRPPREISPGKFAPSSGGDIAALRPLSDRVKNKLKALHTEVCALQLESNASLNEMGRWGDAAVPNPVNDLCSLLGAVLDLIRRLKRI